MSLSDLWLNTSSFSTQGQKRITLPSNYTYIGYCCNFRPFRFPLGKPILPTYGVASHCRQHRSASISQPQPRCNVWKHTTTSFDRLFSERGLSEFDSVRPPVTLILLLATRKATAWLPVKKLFQLFYRMEIFYIQDRFHLSIMNEI